ncbi:MAG: serine/threonine-protein kinase [Longimicrobiales bacterium]|nr:serine/threonine-protein kinase [Longimicrobiales bacterium]
MDPTPRTPEALDQALGDEFEVVRLLGSGSVATVYLARERSLSRLVAVKVMHASVATDETARRRFEREARAAASLSDNPNVVSVHRYGRLPDETPYMVMRYVKGRTMDERLQAEGRLRLEEGLEVLDAVADALTLAHSKGFVHRDVRPGNVLWDEEAGRALLSDFGIAAVLATGGTDVTRLTSAGELLGDPRYTSPEQLMDGDVTEAADIYAFGILGYEILSGEGPYPARSRMEMIQAHLTAEPRDLRTLRPDVPPAVADMLRRCLARDPRHRPSAQDVARALRGGYSGARSAAGEAIPAMPEGADLQTLLRKRVPQVVLITGGVGFGIAQLVEGFGDARLYTATLALIAAAVAASAVVAWFHGERGRQRAPLLEWVLLSVIGAAGLALSARIYLGG